MTHLASLYSMLTLLVLLGGMLIILLLTLPQPGEDIYLKKLLISLFPLLRLGKGVLLSFPGIDNVCSVPLVLHGV